MRGWDFGNGDNDPMDKNGHGTHVAGTIAAVGNNGLGVIGVAPKAKIMPIKGFGDNGGGDTNNLAKGIEYGALMGADVINNSWSCSNICQTNPIVEKAVRAAHALGTVVVFAAGNNAHSTALRSPQNMRSTKPVVVAASTPSDAPASFTNFGISVDVAAPGTDILSVKMNGGYYRLSGTSIAAPHAACLAALVLAHRPNLTNAEVRLALRPSAAHVNSAGFMRHSSRPPTHPGAGRSCSFGGHL